MEGPYSQFGRYTHLIFGLKTCKSSSMTASSVGPQSDTRFKHNRSLYTSTHLQQAMQPLVMQGCKHTSVSKQTHIHAKCPSSQRRPPSHMCPHASRTHIHTLRQTEVGHMHTHPLTDHTHTHIHTLPHYTHMQCKQTRNPCSSPSTDAAWTRRHSSCI